MPYPKHKVLGLVPSEEAARRVIETLKGVGVSEGEIEFWRGPEGAEAIDTNFEQAGPMQKIKRFFMDVYGEEGENLHLYQEGLRNGEHLLAVPAGPETKGAVMEAMAEQGGHFINYYDDMTVETLAL